MAKDKKISLIISAKNQAKGAFASVKKGLSDIGGLAKKLFSPTGLILGGLGALGLGKLASSFIETASSFEGLEASLTTTLGSLDKARQAIAYANKEAAASPYTVLEYGEAIKTLSAYGIDYAAVMQTVGDTAASMGKPLQQAVEALADALQGEGERLKEFGIKQKIAGDQITYTWVDAMGKVRNTVAQNSPEIIQQTLLAIWNEKYQGGMEKFGTTWKGLTSTAKSLWDEFKLAIANSGTFELLKNGLQVVIGKINEAKKAGDFQKWAQQAGEAVFTVARAIVESIPRVLIMTLEVISKITMGFRGWQMLIGELKIAFLGFARIAQSVLGGIAEGAAKVWSITNIFGQSDDLINDLRSFADNQKLVAQQLQADRDAEIRKQQQTIAGYTKEQQEIEGYKRKVAEMEGAFKNFVAQVNTAAAAQKETGEAAKEGSAMAINAMQDEGRAIEALIAKYRRLNEAAGRRGGSFSVAGLDQALDDAERTE